VSKYGVRTLPILHTCISQLLISADGNLYVGTSAAEILHFVLLPPEPSDASEEPTAIIASRLEPPHNDPDGPGVQQILLLPKVNKACILCNNTLSIYSLPELSPESNFKPIPCLWVGGVDLNEEDDDGADGVVVVIGLKKRLRLVQISENSPPKALKAIEYGGCLVSVRRDTFSCAADAHSYALLDVVHQQKIGLFPISSLAELPRVWLPYRAHRREVSPPQAHNLVPKTSSAVITGVRV
jgi:hypothetical protein